MHCYKLYNAIGRNTRFRWIVDREGRGIRNDQLLTFAIDDVYIGNGCPGDACSRGQGLCSRNAIDPSSPHCSCNEGFSGTTCDKVDKPALVSIRMLTVLP